MNLKNRLWIIKIWPLLDKKKPKIKIFLQVDLEMSASIHSPFCPIWWIFLAYVPLVLQILMQKYFKIGLFTSHYTCTFIIWPVISGVFNLRIVFSCTVAAICVWESLVRILFNWVKSPLLENVLANLELNTDIFWLQGSLLSALEVI